MPPGRTEKGWRKLNAYVAGRSSNGSCDQRLETDGEGRWRIDGHDAPHLNGCLDVDLESSAFTNALPVHRPALGTDMSARAPAASVRALDLSVERLEQHDARTGDQDGHQRYDYRALTFDFSCQLIYDEAGLVLMYPGIAMRAA